MWKMSGGRRWTSACAALATAVPALLAVAPVPAATAAAPAVTLDASWASDGRVYVNGGVSSTRCVSADVPNTAIAGGKSISASTCTTTTSTALVLTRLTAGGLVDTTYGQNGHTVLSDRFWQLGRVQPDGTVYAVGSTMSGTVSVTRVLASGVVDTAYGTAGVTSAPVPASQWLQNLTVDGSGRAVLTFSGLAAANTTFVRFTPAGQRDASFGASGVVARSGRSLGSAVVGSDAIVWATTTYSGSTAQLTVERLRASDGALDPTFGTAGATNLSATAAQAPVADFAVLADGSSAALLSTWNGATPTMRMIRLTAAGAFDSTFEGDGVLVESGRYASTLTVDPTGPTFVTSSGGSSSVWVGRVTATGVLADSGSLNLTQWGRPVSMAQVLPITTAGWFYAAAIDLMSQGWMVARFDANLDLDMSYSGDGAATILGPFDFGTEAHAAVVDTDRLRFGSDPVVQLTATGIPDTSWAGDGFAELGLTAGDDDSASQAMVDGAGRLVLVSRHGEDGVARRLTAAGAIDTSFGTAGLTVLPGAVADQGHGIVTSPTVVGFDAASRPYVQVYSWSFDGYDPDTYVSATEVVRLLADGTVDASYDSATFVGEAMSVDAAGRVLVFEPGAGTPSIRRLTAAGGVDPSFAATTLPGLDVYPGPLSTSVVGDGRVIVCGPFACVRTGADGGLDATFGQGGTLAVPHLRQDGQDTARVAGLVALPDGSATTIVISSYGGYGGQVDQYVGRISVDGTWDADFSGDGFAALADDIDATSFLGSGDPVLLPMPSAVAVLVMQGGTPAVLRLTASGELDTSFAGDGTAALPAVYDSWLTQFRRMGDQIVAGYDHGVHVVGPAGDVTTLSSMAMWFDAVVGDSALYIAGETARTAPGTVVPSTDLAVEKYTLDRPTAIVPTPQATNDAVTATGGGGVVIAVTANDASSTPLAPPTIVQAPSHGTVTVSSGRISYTPQAGFVGTDTFRYEVCAAADLLLCARATVTITVDPSTFTSLTPTRLFDTRTSEAQGAITITKQRYGGDQILEIKITDTAGIPATGVGAVSLNVTAINPDGPGYITVYPCADGRPLAANLNYTTGQIVPNAVIAPVDTNGKICLYSYATTDIVADLNGWFAAG